MQFASLERRTSSLEKDRVDHGLGGHDDTANVAAGAMVLAGSEKPEEVPIIAPIIVGRTRTVSGGTASTEAAWRDWAYGTGNTDFWGPMF